MCRVATTALAATELSAQTARHWMTELLERWELPGLADTAELVTSELVTNAIGHAASHPTVVVAVADGFLEVGVNDRDPRLPRLADRPRDPADRDDPMAEGGRGLVIVDALAHDWGAVPLPEGKHVWFRLETTDWSHQSACRCHGEDVGRVRLETGRYALAIPGPWDSPPPA